MRINLKNRRLQKRKLKKVGILISVIVLIHNIENFLDPEVETLSKKLENTHLDTEKKSSNAEKEKKDAEKVEVEISTDKKIKNLKKKVREIEALEEKLKNGSVTKPEPEQLQKIKRKNDLLLQIHELEKTL